MLTFRQPKEISLRPYQMDAVEALRQGIAQQIQNDELRRQILVAPTGAGKCLGRGTPILMADGMVKPVEEVRVGDRLASPTGAPNTVVSLARGREQMFRVTPTKGDAYTCNASHLLSLKMTGGKDTLYLADGQRIGGNGQHVVCRADVLFASSKTARHCLKGWRGTVAAFDGERDDLPVPPYVFGVWLGDGSKRTDTCAITKPEGVVSEEWRAWAASLGASIRRSDSNGTRCETWHTRTEHGKENPCLIAMRATGIDVETCEIPLAYKTASWSSRAELLAGLLDTDGAVSRGGWDYISKHRALAEGVAFIARSIGLAAYVSECEKGIRATGFVGTYWRVSISGDATLVPCRAKRPPPRRINKDPLRHGITLEPIGEGEYFGFELDGDRLFMLGDFTVTHNTVIASHLLKQASDKQRYALFLVDRVSLVDQTSATLDDYGIPHGVLQGLHQRYAPREHVQVCSIQTLARRSLPRQPELIVYDEAHCIYEAAISLMDLNPRATCLGLTATPFTPGLGQHWRGIVNVTTTRKLIDDGFLVEPKIYVARSPEDAELGLNSFGEFSDKGAETAGIRIVGDVVEEWIGKTQQHFGGPVKTIVFSPSVAHGRELCDAFAARGFNFQQISYLDKDDDARKVKIDEFRQPDSVIHGLVSCGVLTKGFDVADVRCGISCRPYRKSLSSHLQEIGRIMRPMIGEQKHAIWLDHSGNIERFAVDMFDVWENGAGDLSQAEARDKTPRKRDESTRERSVCPECSGVLRMNICLSCGWEKPVRSGVANVDGQMHEFELGPKMEPRAGLRAACLKDPKGIYEAALAYALDNGRDEERARKRAYAIWRGIFPASKPGFGWYQMPRPSRYDWNAYALVEREVRRYRKNARGAA